MPPGRKPVKTRVVDRAKRDEVYAWVRGKLEKREQAFIVAPAIGGGGAEPEFEAQSVAELEGEREEEPRAEPGADPAGESANVRALAKELEEGPLKGLRVAVMHGRLKHQTRERLMERFRAGQIDALIATTVIEVGVDVPNATMMVVEDADKFGLAQLHQLRGRVGRGEKASACVLIASGGELTEEGRRRLDVIAEVSDGFVLAERDLEIRGPGELFGVRQSGMPPFRVADFSRDMDLLKMARRDAAEWVGASPNLARPEDALVRRRLLKAHGKWLGLGDVG
jgi:ATP-dependent DNA helicase RecG